MRNIIESRFRRNLDRVRSLSDIYANKLALTGQGRRPVAAADLLRAAVVFLHATLEDFLRSVGRWKLPDASKAVLDKVPLLGLSPQGRPEKFFLGELAEFKGKTVDELIANSIEAYLDTSSYNDTTEVATFLASIGLVVQAVNSRFGDLQDMMKRRHHIVHQADANEATGSGHYSAKSISQTQVQTWIDAVEEFMLQVLHQL